MRRTNLLVAILLISLTACFAEEAPQRNQSASEVTATCSALGGTFSGVEFNDDQGSYAVSLANNAAADTLQEIDGIGAKIAQRIIAARPFATLADLDSVSYVGAKILGGFRAHANTRAVLDWANSANRSELTAVCQIGNKTAEAIEAARPIDSLDDLLAVRNIGEETLKTLLGVPGFSCSTKGSVIDEWCGEDGAACYCSTGVEPPTGFVLDEDAASNWAEEAAGEWYFDNADYAWEEWCQGNYDESAYDEFDAMNFCERYVLERFIPAAITAAIALAGTSYADEDTAQQAVIDLVKDIFRAAAWMGDFEAALIDYLGAP